MSESIATRLLSDVLWLGVAVVALGAFWGAWITLAHSRTDEAWEGALEKDKEERRQAVANIIFTGLLVGGALGTAGLSVSRLPSPPRTAVLWGSLAAAGAGLFGAALSQYAPLWSHPFAPRAYPFAPHQLSYLTGHALLCGLVGAVFGAGAGALQSRS